MDNLDFAEIADRKPTQEFDIPQGRDVGEYHVMSVLSHTSPATYSSLRRICRPAKFPAVQSITLFFPESQGAETTRVYFIGFLGQFSEVRAFDASATICEDAEP